MGWMVDPKTGDYVLTTGAWVRDESLQTPVYLRLCSERGSCPDDLEFGSRLHELHRRKSARLAALEAPDIVAEALRPLVSEGRVSKVETVATAEGAGVRIAITVYDAGLRPYRFQVFQPVAA